MKKLWAILGICALTLCACGQKADDLKETKAETAETVETAQTGETEAAGTGSAEDKGTLILATTTSTKDSGLLDEILPVFEEATGYQVQARQ